jgi:mRNA interferase RelE/StbE
MYKVGFNRKAEKELTKLPPTIIRSLLKAISALQDDPRPSGCKKLKGSELWRIRDGDYRVVYEIDDKNREIIVWRVRHRKDAYSI